MPSRRIGQVVVIYWDSSLPTEWQALEWPKNFHYETYQQSLYRPQSLLFMTYRSSYLYHFDLRSELSSTSTIPPDYLHKNSDQYTGRKNKVIQKRIPQTLYRIKITRIISLLFLYFSPGGASDIHLFFRFESSEIVVSERAEVQLATIGAFKYHSVKSGWCLCGHYLKFVMTHTNVF